MGKGDKAVVLLVLAGDRKAYGELVHRYKNMVFKAVYAAVRDYHAAEDLTQDVFVDGYIKLKSLGEPYHFGAWLLQMAKYKCCNYLTRSAIRFESELPEYYADEKTPTPETLVIEQAERQAVRQAVLRLPDRQKTVVELYYGQNVPQSKIADLLQIPVGTVSRRLYDARTKLKKELEPMDGTIQNKNFEEEVARKIKALEDYYHLNRFSADGKEKAVDDLIRLADAMPESKLKHRAYASAYRHSDKEERRSKAQKEAELGENADVYQDLFWDKYAGKNDDEAWLNAIDSEEGLAKLEKMEQSDKAVGAMLFWRGACNMRLKRYAEARADFEKALKKLKQDDSYFPNAIACIKAIDRIAPDEDRYISGYRVTGECYRLYNGGKQLDFVNQPGFGENYPVPDCNFFGSIYYYASNGGQNHNGWFFDLSGGKSADENVSVAENETVSVLAGTFGDCLHIRFDTKEDWGSDVVYESWYAKDVGLVKFRASMNHRPEEVYELCEYKINGGTGYMPAAVGNLWRYKNSNLSEIHQQVNEYEITAVMDDPATKSQYIYMAAVQIERSSWENCDSDTHIVLAQKALPDEKPEKWDFAAAITQLKLANQKNTSVRASLFARHALEFQKRCAEYAQNKWVFLPSGVYGGVIRKDTAGGQIRYKENEVYYLELDVNWGPWYGARRCIGLKPFRFLQMLAGTLYSEKWVDGFTETRNVGEDGDVSIKAEDGGTVTTKAGTFDHCVKVTFQLEWEGGQGDEAYYLRGLRHSHCGTKIFWFAPNVGIVKHDCIWGAALTSSIELTEYSSCATNGEYMPVYVGSRWVYDEVTLPAEFIARKTYDIASGMEDEFFLIENQEMLFQGTKGEYEAFQKTREK